MSTLRDLYYNIRGMETKKEQQWHYLLRRDKNLAVVRKMFRKKFNKPDKSHIRLVTEFLMSKELFLLLGESKVRGKVDEISSTLVSRLRQFKMRNLQPKGRIEKYEYCFTKREDISKLISGILNIFNMHIFIGEGNTAVFQDWVLKKSLREPMYLIPNFKPGEMEFVRAFKAKSVLRDRNPHEKNSYRGKLLQNVMHGLFWWALAAMRECVIPIQSNKEEMLLWRRGYLQFLKAEMMDFKRRYGVKRVDKKEVIGHIGSVKIRTIRKKLRPVFPKSCSTMKKRREQYEYWRLLTSRLRFLMESNGVFCSSIKESCQKIKSFLDRHKSETVHGFTEDITKCFSNVSHEILMKCLEGLVAVIGNKQIFSMIGEGNGVNDSLKTYCCTAFSEEEVKKKLNERLTTLKRTRKFDVKKTTVQKVFEVVTKHINNYQFRRGKTNWRITRGVPQGHPLSSLLSNLYLTSFEESYWRDLIENAGDKLVYSRYEDDYIFCTTDKEIVERMLKPLCDGQNSYQLHAREIKKMPSEEKIEWCGVQMDLKLGSFKQRKRLRNGMLVDIAMKL